MAKAKDFKLYMLIAHVKYFPRDNKLDNAGLERGNLTI